MATSIFCLADLHGHLPEDVPSCDLLILAGDITPGGRRYGRHSVVASWLDTEFRRWLASVPATHIVATWGNHDRIGQERPDLVPKDLPWHLLVDESIELAGYRIHGSPWSLEFMDWAFMASEAEMERICEGIPRETDILISHGPPYGYGDRVTTGEHVGSLALANRIHVIRPLLTVCGHIHEASGMYTIPEAKTMVSPPLNFLVNASVRDMAYRIQGNGYMVEIDMKKYNNGGQWLYAEKLDVRGFATELAIPDEFRCR